MKDWSAMLIRFQIKDAQIKLPVRSAMFSKFFA